MVIFKWPISSYFGWGVYGLNLLLSWWRVIGPSLLTSAEINESAIVLNDLEKERLKPALDQSRALHDRLRAHDRFDAAMLHAMGNDLLSSVGISELSGNPNLGIVFCDSTEFSNEARERASLCELMVAGSTWNCEILKHAGLGPSIMIPQGIDPSRFHPGQRTGLFADRFTIFSGGKLEFRKGQDLVLLAFRAFAQRHAEALLITAWSSPWSHLARSVEENSAISPMRFRPNGKVDCKTWAIGNGILSHQVLDLGVIANSELPNLYREMDVALFPNRCEAGTNLVAMECMACGVPAILSRNTGHLDLIASDRCIPLERQTALDGASRLGWGESDVEEIIESLEIVYRDRSAARDLGVRSAEFMTRMTWDQTASRLAEVIRPYQQERIHA
jgi:glycosyltransferase involved in cell wall biosynthesis